MHHQGDLIVVAALRRSEAGWRQVGGDPLRRRTRTPRTATQERELRQADLTDEAELYALMDGVGTVFHLAGASSPASAWEEVLESTIVGQR